MSKFGKTAYSHVGNIYYCTINYKNHIFMGIAVCKECDKEFEHENIGYTIAETRAEIKRLSYDKELARERLSALIHLRETSRIVESDNMNRKLNEQIALEEEKIDLINNSIKSMRENLYTYITTKEKLWKYIRTKESK